ncbi:MAG: T9SS type B sorting domain-containing protein [Luteibaculaceae bacterium]
MYISKFSIIIFFVLLQGLVLAQQNFTISPENNVVECGESATYTLVDLNNVGGESLTVTQFGSLSLTDDIYSGVINIGFTFEFFGIPYTQLLISSNNYVTFNLGSAGQFSGFSINPALPVPNPTVKPNSIMSPFQDINPGVGGTISFITAGTAPNRVFIVSYEQIPMFQCTDQIYTSQIHLYEGCNTIETHIQNKPVCATFNGGQAIHAVHNATGTIAVVVGVDGPNGVVQSRNAGVQWLTAEEGTRFIPIINEAGQQTYEWEFISYCFIPLGGGAVANGSTITLCQIVEWEFNGEQIGIGNPINFATTQSGTLTATLSPSCPTDGFQFEPVSTQIFIPTEPIVTDTTLCFGQSILTAGGVEVNTTGFYSDTLITPTGCTAIFNLNLFVEPIPMVVRDTTICKGDFITVGNAIYNTSGTYIDTLQISPNGCLGKFINTLVVTEPTVNFQRDEEFICISLEQFITVEPTASNFNSLLWNTGSTSQSLFINEEGIYTITAFDEFGCSNEASLIVSESCPPIIFIPNSFTPNNDGLNDNFAPTITGVQLTRFLLILRDRWGNTVFQSDNLNTPWNGQISNGSPAPSGIYSGFVEIDYLLKGEKQTDKKWITVNLIR